MEKNKVWHIGVGFVLALASMGVVKLVTPPPPITQVSYPIEPKAMIEPVKPVAPELKVALQPDVNSRLEPQEVMIDGTIELEVPRPTVLNLRFRDEVRKIEVGIHPDDFDLVVPHRAKSPDEKIVPLSQFQKDYYGVAEFNFDPFHDYSKSRRYYNDMNLNLTPAALANWTEIPCQFIITTTRGKQSIIWVGQSLRKEIRAAQTKSKGN
ncbi:MAG: hypothetical protein K1Y36_24490 [Blastocatellia bacterium]|nr:hypothetical protein [Blastocatellia bacterium]